MAGWRSSHGGIALSSESNIMRVDRTIVCSLHALPWLHDNLAFFDPLVLPLRLSKWLKEALENFSMGALSVLDAGVADVFITDELIKRPPKKPTTFRRSLRYRTWRPGWPTSPRTCSQGSSTSRWR
jgi:hypothetical protein